MGFNLNKGDGKFSKEVLGKLKVTVDTKRKVNGAEWNGTKIIILKGKKMVYLDDKLYESLINEFKELVEKAQAEHVKTAVAAVEKAIPDVEVNDKLSNSAIKTAFQNWNHILIKLLPV